MTYLARALEAVHVGTDFITPSCGASKYSTAVLPGATSQPQASPALPNSSQSITPAKLSTRTQAGIGVGGGIAILAFLAGIFLLLRRIKRNRKLKTQAFVAEQTFLKSELDGQEVNRHVITAEAPGKLIHEFEDTSRPVEIDSRRDLLCKVGDKFF